MENKGRLSERISKLPDVKLHNYKVFEGAGLERGKTMVKEAPAAFVS